MSAQWTHEEDMRLRQGYGLVALEVMARELGKTMEGVRSRITRLKLRVPPRPGMTLGMMVNEWGYSRKRIEKALMAVKARSTPIPSSGRGVKGQVKKTYWPGDCKRALELLHATPPTRAVLWMGKKNGQKGFWGSGQTPDRCQGKGCGRMDRPHYAKGCCKACYMRAWRRERAA